ncbi:Asp-tRNA(Asn)/Glu-tRNA(Gln) amidotransferase subunit GatB [Candidatus Anaplasma sp. TIGMIC]|uniref:Asp-tRNA(Asn)/Glu-tRNA(Gln) amidotransferase subunit GatB n=1 Tax=Candidatus Anaplasma sp. TIGMIC TaxID=3020713 RepID=UPI0023311C38|nr:Asp-tRNA(Asn)/Glu-tRNA(Gln) amidotransferase subunit GatB [Candidatus Anaplasma sp. TIGMIC]MDB1135088.1 Asp-tRNA(Asn)/Glu-tRNA(Gln) amidotransferase subunit GatB [Candidatus Anaplasma sp. TIGMIC]
MSASGTIKGNRFDWEMVIGLEVHAQVTSESKLFSPASACVTNEPNTRVALLDIAMPGMLPVTNLYCIKQAVKTALALSCEVNRYSVFDRKNYFYPDLPSGYQITQFYHPIARDGHIILDETADGKKIGITRIHLEQDAGKSMHVGERTCLDFNRAGVALMEIVTEPDLRSHEEAAEYLKKLRMILRCIGTCSGDMENGALRCDANVSVRRVGESGLGVRSEIKNLNSIKYVAQAIKYEACRHVEVLESGGKLEQSTLLYDVETGTTRTMRSKEDVCDYRYFPDPDLLPLKITEEFIDEIKASIPELPMEKMARYMRDLSLSRYDAAILSSDKDISEYFDRVIEHNLPAELAASWVTGELFGALNKRGTDIGESPIGADALSELLSLIVKGTISGKLAKQVFAIMFETGRNAEAIVEEQGLQQISDESALSVVVDEAIEQNLDKVLQYKQGKEKLFGYFVGQVMQKTKGKANPDMVNALMKSKLDQK